MLISLAALVALCVFIPFAVLGWVRAHDYRARCWRELADDAQATLGRPLDAATRADMHEIIELAERRAMREAVTAARIRAWLPRWLR